MNTRMDKYAETPNLKSRTERNKHLYEDIKNTDIDSFDIKSNAEVLDEDYNVVDVDKIRDMLDKKYRDTIPKKHLTTIEEAEEETKKIIDTKEYDINAILDKAKKEQNVDYEKERFKKIRDTQFDILNSLNIKEEVKTDDETEENLVNLINTITALELKNKKEENSTALDLLSDLSEDKDDLHKTMELDKEDLEETNTDIDMKIDENYDDFKELENDLKSSSIAIKIVVIVFILILLIILFIFLNNHFGWF